MIFSSFNTPTASAHAATAATVETYRRGLDMGRTPGNPLPLAARFVR
jgi:hypothetical protein